MSIELRPLSVGEILDRTSQLYRSHFLLFVGISIFPTSVLLLLGLGGLAVSRYSNAGGGKAVAAVMITGVAAVRGGFLYAVLLGISLAATNRAVSNLYIGLSASIAGAYRQVGQHWFRYIWLMFVAIVYASAPCILVLSVVFGGISLMAALHLGSTVAALSGIIAVIATLLVIPLGIWMTLRYSLSVPASIVEDLGIHASLKRSVFLTSKGRGRIFVMMLLVVVISVVLSSAVQSPFLILASVAAKSNSVIALLSLAASQVGSFIVNAMLAPVYGIAITLFYYDERIRKEAFDIEWMMQRANLGDPDQPPVVDNPLEAGVL